MSYQSDLSKTLSPQQPFPRCVTASSIPPTGSSWPALRETTPQRLTRHINTEKALRVLQWGWKSACLLDSHFSQGHLTPRCSFPSNIFCLPRGPGVVHTGMADLLDNARPPLHGTQCPLEAASAWLQGIISHPPASHSEL